MTDRDYLRIDFETVANKTIQPSLEGNLIRFSEFAMKLSEKDAESINNIKRSLLELPLLHRSPSRIPTGEAIVSSQKIGKVVATGPLDQSLFLDRFVYLSWGPSDHIYSREKHYLVDSRILLEPNVVVTETDITTFTYGGTQTPFKELPHKMRGSIIRGYFGKMLRGSDWLELTARKIFVNHKNGNSLFEIWGPVHLGEIKVANQIDPKSILKEAVSLEERRALTQLWIEHGFNPSETKTGMINDYWTKVIE